MIIQLLILTAVHVHAGSQNSSPVSTPSFAPISGHLPPGDDLDLGPSCAPQAPAQVQPAATVTVSNFGHMNFTGRATPQGFELPNPNILKVRAILFAAANKSNK